MKFGMDQLNVFDTFTLDCWEDDVYYEGQKFPAGYFAAEILNFAGEVQDPILERISTVTELVDQAASSGKDVGKDILVTLRPLMQKAVTWIFSCPPFCFCNNKFEWNSFAMAMDVERFCWDYDTNPEHLPFYFLSFSEQVMKILVSIYNFCLLIRVFEEKYLRGLERRTESSFARVAHNCFDEDDNFLKLLEQMPYGEIEEFFSAPRMILGFSYIQDPNDTQRCLMAQRIICKRLIDFYVFDLMNGLRHGHGPSQCRNCHRYFLTTTAHVPKYCDGMAPQDSRMTCRQYGAMMRQKEQNKQHPVYRLFSTRTNTVRKHHQRGKISDDLRREALRLAESYRDKALLDNDYAEHSYALDMEQEHLYREARKRVREKEGG